MSLFWNRLLKKNERLSQKLSKPPEAHSDQTNSEVTRGWRVIMSTKGFNDAKRGASSLAFSANEQVVASGVADGSICLWSVMNGKCLAKFNGHYGMVVALAFLPSGASLLASLGGEPQSAICVWDLSQLQRRTNFNLQSTIAYPAAGSFSYDRKLVASGDNDGAIHVLQVTTGKVERVIKAHKSFVVALSFSQQGFLASAGNEGTLKLWSAGFKKELGIVSQSNVESLAFSPDGAVLAVAQQTGGSIRLLEVPSLEEIAVFSISGGFSITRDLAFSPDSQTLAAATAGAKTDEQYGNICLWDIASGSLSSILRHESSWELSKQSVDSAIDLYKAGAESFAAANLLFRSGTNSIIFSPSGHLLASGGADGSIFVWKRGVQSATT